MSHLNASSLMFDLQNAYNNSAYTHRGFNLNRQKSQSLIDEASTIINFTRSNSLKSNLSQQPSQTSVDSKNLNYLNKKTKRGRRSKAKKIEKKMKQKIVESEIATLDYSVENYEVDLREVENDLSHSFMKKHFPELYRQDNFYKFVKSLQKNKKEKRNSIIDADLKEYTYQLKGKTAVPDDKNTKDSLPRKIWSPKSMNSISFSFEKLFFDIQVSSSKYQSLREEDILEFLFINKDNIEEAELMIVNKDPKFVTFLNGKKEKYSKLVNTDEKSLRKFRKSKLYQQLI